MKNNFFKNVFIPRLISSLLIAAPLTMTLLSSIYYLGFNVSELSAQVTTSFVMSLLSIFSWALATFIAVFYKKKTVGAFFAFIWWLCFLSYVSFFVFGADSIFSDTFFGTLTLIFSLPAWSYMSIVEAFGFSEFYLQVIASLTPAFIIALVNTVFSVRIHLWEKGLKETVDNE